MALAIYSFSFSVVPHVMSLNIDMKIIRNWNCAGSHILFMSSWTFVDELQCGEFWENIPLEFHRLSVNCVQSSVLR